MARVRSSGTRIERQMWKLLRHLHLSFKKNVHSLPGCPDLVFPDFRLAAFLDGDFWHGRSFAKSKLKLNAKWRAKISRNIARDRRVGRSLARLGWHVLRLWEGDIKKSPQAAAERVLHQCTKTMKSS